MAMVWVDGKKHSKLESKDELLVTKRAAQL